MMKLSRIRHCAIFLAFIVSACATTTQIRWPPSAQVTLNPGDAKIGTYISRPKGFTTSSYWIEGPNGLVFIDTQFLLSAADEMIDWAELATGKKVVLGIVLHPNPDKFNGVEVFKRRHIPVVTSTQVRTLIPSVHEDRHHWFYERFKPDYPDQAPIPDSFGPATTTLNQAGVPIKVHVLGPGCSEAHVVVEYNGHVFAGDLISNLHHAWMEIGKVDEWLERLAYIKKLDPEFVHPGRGPTGGAELIDRQIAYLKKVKELIAKERPKMPPPEAALMRVQKKLEELYVGYGNAYFLEIGLPAVWESMASKRF